MKTETGHHPNDESWQISECHCGQLTLRIGAVRLDLTREEFLRLHRLVDDASRQLQTEVTAPGPAIMH